MAITMNEILLKITGDEDDAERSLKAVATDLEAFSRLSATAEATVDTEHARLELERMEEALDELDARSADPEIRVKTALARAEIAGLQRRLDAFERNDLELDVDIRRGLLDDLRLLAGNMGALHRASEAFGPQGKALSDRIADIAVNMGPFTTQLKTALPLMLGLSAVIASVAGGLAAMAASLAAAVGGLAALAVALGGVFSVTVLAGFAAFQRFQQQSEKQGTAAYALAQAFEDVQKAFKQLLPAVDPILRALAQIMKAVGPLIRSIVPAFKQFGRVAGDALGIIARALRDPAIQQGLRQLIRLSSEALTPMVKIAVRLGRALLNIANAALPHLVGMLEDVADGFGSFARGTDNTKKLGGTIDFLVSNLRSWLKLIGAIADIFLGFIKAAAPQGQELVDWITEGAQGLADFLGSTEGQSQIRAFLADVIPLFKDLVTFVGQLFVTFMRLGQAVAPLVQPIVQAFTDVLKIVSGLLGWFNKLPGPVRQLVAIAVAVLNPFNKLSLLVRGLILIFQGIYGVAKGVFVAIGHFVGGAVRQFRSKFGPAIQWIINAFKDVWEFIKSLPGKIKNALVGLWNIITHPFKTAKNVIGAILDWLLDKVESVIQGIEDAAQTAKDVVDFIGGGIGTEEQEATMAEQAAAAAIRSQINELLQAGKTLQTISKAFKEEMRAAGLKPSDFFPSEKAMRDAGSRAGKAGAQGMRDQFPGSEPKAHDSPLRHFDRAGRALMESFVAGMKGGGAAASREMAHGLRVGLGQGARKLAVAGAQRDGQRSNFHIPVTVAGGGSPDPQAFVGVVSRRLRAKGLSIQ